MSELEQFAVRCEQATGPDRLIDYAIGLAMGLHAVAIDDHRLIMAGSRTDKAIPAYTASLDAAMTLVPERYGFQVDGFGDHWWSSLSEDEGFNARAATPALALTAAALRSRAKGDAA